MVFTSVTLVHSKLICRLVSVWPVTSIQLSRQMIAVSRIIVRPTVGFRKTPQKPLAVTFSNEHPLRNRIIGLAVVRITLGILVRPPSLDC